MSCGCERDERALIQRGIPIARTAITKPARAAPTATATTNPSFPVAPYMISPLGPSGCRHLWRHVDPKTGTRAGQTGGRQADMQAAQQLVQHVDIVLRKSL